MSYHHSKEDAPVDSWYTQIGRLKRIYGSLTNADLNYSENQKDEMLEALGKKLGVKERDILDVMYRVKKEA